MSTQQLVDFLNKTQRDPRLNEILYPYANPARAKELIAQYEPNKFNVQKGQLSLDGFLRYGQWQARIIFCGMFHAVVYTIFIQLFFFSLTLAIKFQIECVW